MTGQGEKQEEKKEITKSFFKIMSNLFYVERYEFFKNKETIV